MVVGIHSFYAIQGSNKSEKKHWLTFWTLHACVQALELAIDIFFAFLQFTLALIMSDVPNADQLGVVNHLNLLCCVLPLACACPLWLYIGRLV